jgi:tetratricopeptide (TPR) repeat protein
MRRWLSLIALFAAIALWGCAGIKDSMSAFLRAGPWWQAAQAGTIRSQATALEARGELAMALDRWRLLRHVSFHQAEADREIARLEKKIAASVKTRYQEGLAALKKHHPAAARDHFLAALRLDPTFRPALEEINARFSPFPLTVYRTAAGDRPAAVAEKVFGDKDKAFLVAWFNDLPVNADLKPGTMLILPKAASIASIIVPERRTADLLAKARARLKEADFAGALTLAHRADTADREVQQLIHRIYLKQATDQIESGLLDDARQSLARVPDGFAGRNGVLKKLSAAVKQHAITLDLEKAWRHFDQGRYRQSLALAQMLLQQAPGSVAARRMADESRYRLALDDVHHKRYLAARKVLENADESHKPSMVLKKIVRRRLAHLAQIHYRNGVKYFINEDLQSAIAEWEKALTYNPNLPKARENIANARRLIQKIKALP